MDTVPTESNRGLLFANFNQDFGCIVSVTGRGFRIFNSDPLREKEARHFLPSADDHPLHSETPTLEAMVGYGHAKIVKAEMLFRCNYVALVVAPPSTGPCGKAMGHRVIIWDDIKQLSVIHLDFNAEVCGVRLRRDRIVVVMESMIKVYTFTVPPQQLHVFDSAPNWKGLCSLSSSSANSLLAFPALNTDVASYVGIVKLMDLANTEKSPLIVPAHATCLSCLTLNIQGTRLATSSDKGTLIRIFDTCSGSIINELRRGTQPATIYSINFSVDSTLLVVSSSHGTIHVFSVEDSSRNKHSSFVSTATSMVGNLFGGSTSSGSSHQVTSSSASSTFNKLVPKYFTSEWSFSKIDVPGAARCIVAFSGSSSQGGVGTSAGSSSKNNDLAILAVCEDGSYHKFVYDQKKEVFTRDVYQMFVEINANEVF